MKIVATADIHGGAPHLCTIEEQERTLDALAGICREQQAEALLIGGDLFHHNRPTPEVIMLIARFFEKLGIPVVLSKGNHDPDAAEIARYFRGQVTVPHAPEVVRQTGLDIAVMPYLPDSLVRARSGGVSTKDEIARLLTAKVREFLKALAAQRHAGVPMVLLAHGTVAGTDTSTGWAMGYIPGTNWLIPIEELAPFDLSFIGHIHRPQEPNEKIIVPGSLLPLDFSETEPKRVVVADVTRDSAKWESITVPTPRVHTIDLPHRDVSVEDFVGDAANYIDAGDKYRIRVKCSEEAARLIPPSRISTALYAAGASLVQVELTVQRPDRERAGVPADTGPQGVLARYLEGRGDLGAVQRDHVAACAEEVAVSLGGPQALGGGDLDLVQITCHGLLGVADATIDLDGHGVYVLTGPNGAGKSTIGVDTLRFALHGTSRAGAKPSERLIRAGADEASASVELRTSTDQRYRIVRKLKRGSRGTVSSTLDVLQQMAPITPDAWGAWVPLSTGKVADGEAHIARILGDLSDEVLVASSIAVQRQADAFTRARPEDRKRVLAQAAGLQVYEQLGDASRDKLRARERDLSLLGAKAEPLRSQVAGIAEIEARIANADAALAVIAARLADLERKRDAAEKNLTQERERAATYDRILSDATALDDRIRALDAELADWARKKSIADQIVAEKARLVKAQASLEAVRAELVVLEARQVADGVQMQRRALAVDARAALTDRLDGFRRARERHVAEVSARIGEAERQEERLAEAACCAPEPSCVFLDAARASVATLPALAKDLERNSEATDDEASLIELIEQTDIPDLPDTSRTRRELEIARTRARGLEKDVEVATKIARAEEVLAQHADAVKKLTATRGELSVEKAAKNATLVEFGARPNVDRAQQHKNIAWDAFTRAQADERAALQTVAELRGRFSALVDARAELERVEREITGAAADVAAWTELVTAWRACRVLVLEGNVIPGVEATANDILRRFPHGIQIALTTQREKKSGDGLAETLDIEVLGKGGLYEMCSGGERMALDFALHVALALVVSRRASTRLRLLVCDEPEGLDEQGRAAFAATVRWIHAELGVTCLVMSHADDLVDALGGQRIVVTPGPDGSTVAVA